MKYAESADVVSIVVYKVITFISFSVASPVSPDSLMSPYPSFSPILSSSPICKDGIRCVLNIIIFSMK